MAQPGTGQGRNHMAMTAEDCNRYTQIFNRFADFKELFVLGGYFVQPHIMHVTMQDNDEKNIWHNHRAHEYSLVLQGNMRYRFENRDVVIHPGDAVVIPANTSHCWEMLEPSVIFGFMLHISCTGEGARKKIDDLNTAIVRRNFRIPSFQEGMELMLRLFATADRGYGFLNEKLRCLSQELIIALFDALLPPPKPEPAANREKPRMRGEDPKALVDAVVFYINDNAYRDLSVTDISRHVGVSINHLNAILKTHAGMTANQMIWNRKLFVACHLLNTTNRQVKDIASSVGFDDVGYFCRRFRLSFGESPGVYRLKARSENTPPPSSRRA